MKTFAAGSPNVFVAMSS